MEISVAVLADAANVAAGDKLNILGTFDGIMSYTFPAIHPFMALALRFRLDYSDGRRTHELAVIIHDQDGVEGARAEARITVGDIPAGEHATLNHILNFASIAFDRPGRFYFKVLWDGKEMASVPLKVVQLTGPQP